MTVSRGTAGDDFKVRELTLRWDMRRAAELKHKKAVRRIVSAANSRVQPGKFEGLDLETGRARRIDPPQLRAQCEFDSGRVRVVTVSPLVRKGDLFWIKADRRSTRAESKLTLDVLRVDLARLQDMSEQDAIEEGTNHVQLPARLSGRELPHRERFAWLWDQMNGAGSWAANPWVWVYSFEPFEENIDAMLKRWERRA